MHFQTLLLEAETPADIRSEFEQLVAAKAQTRELGQTDVSAAVRAFIVGEYQVAEETLPTKTPPQSPENIERAKILFYKLATRYSAP